MPLGRCCPFAALSMSSSRFLGHASEACQTVTLVMCVLK